MKQFLKKVLEHIFNSKFTLYDNMEEYEQVKKEKEECRLTGKKTIEIIVKISNLILVFIVGYILFGCTPKTIVKYEPVNVPVVCEVDVPVKPKHTGDVVKDNLQITKYAEEVENALLYCVNKL